MKTFYFRENKDSGNVFLQALLSNGFVRVQNKIPAPESGYEKESDILYQADFMVMDHDYAYKPTPEWEAHFTPAALARRPLFIYPHVPYSYFLWDGIMDPKPVACNFVVSHGAKVAMQLYGYPYRIEVVGYAGAQVQAFQPTQGTRLLFAPAHPLLDGRYPQPEGLQRTRAAARKIIENLRHFESVTIRHSHTVRQCGLDDFLDRRLQRKTKIIFEKIDPYRTPNIRQAALASIASADLVISESTFGHLAIAAGKPVIFYGYDENKIPSSREGCVKNYHLYKNIFHFPLCFETMKIQEILALRRSPNEKIERWKRLNIGDNFNPDKFISVVREYVN